jgi:antirestriction protein ArdC
MKIADLEKQVADQIIDMMKQDGVKWSQRWARARPACNGLTGRAYTGSNVLTTAIWMMCNDASDPRFIPRSRLFNRKDPEQNVGKVRKGCKAIPIVFYGTGNRTDDNGDERAFRFGKVHHLWHVSQIDDLDEDALVDPAQDAPPSDPAERDAALEDWIAGTDAVIRHQGDSAYYQPSTDTITMPPVEVFHSTEWYYSTLLHELTHWTGVPKRLDRDKKYHTDQGRAFEELIAEIGSVMLGMQLGIQPCPREDNAAYVKSWIKHLTTRPQAIFEAASAAGKAQAYLNEITETQMKDAA